MPTHSGKFIKYKNQDDLWLTIEGYLENSRSCLHDMINLMNGKFIYNKKLTSGCQRIVVILHVPLFPGEVNSNETNQLGAAKVIM